MIERKDRYCYNCLYFNGEKGDDIQFCDEKENDVYEDYWCPRWFPKSNLE